MNNPLTTIKPKGNIQHVKQLLATAPAKPQRQFKYLSDSQLEQHMAKIHDYIFSTKVDDYGRNACRQAAKGFAYTIPHIDRYAMDMKRCDITEEDLKRHYRDVWHELPDTYRNKIKRCAERYNRDVAATIKQLQDFVDHHCKHLDTLSDEAIEEVMDLEPHELEVTLATDIRTYIKPAASLSDAALMTPTQIAEYLIVQSKGTCIFWPTNIGKELDRRGFVKSADVNAYFVELVR